VTIPKHRRGERELGIPTLLDRFIQQALLQVLQPLFDPTFSDANYGFRPRRGAHDAVRRAQAYVQEGRSKAGRIWLAVNGTVKQDSNISKLIWPENPFRSTTRPRRQRSLL
jgi:retron-type reverse transcriptase